MKKNLLPLLRLLLLSLCSMVMPVHAQTSFQRTVLLEHFTSLPCVNCPPVDERLEAVVSQRSDVVWVSHHVGYADDEFTLSASSAMTRYGVTGNPFVMLDRTQFDAFSTPAFTIGGLGDDVVRAVFDYEAQQPAPVQLQASSTVDGSTLSISITGQSLATVQQDYPRATLHIYLVEDEVTAQAPQAGDANKKQHDNILREFVTGQRGTLPDWSADGTSFSYATTATLDPSWQVEHLRVVAFLAATAPSGTNYPTGQVLNATQAQVTGTSGPVDPKPGDDDQPTDPNDLPDPPGAAKLLNHDFSTSAQFSGYKVIDQNKDGNTWQYDDSFGAVRCVRDYQADDWLITPAVQLDAQKTYRLTFTASIDFDGGEQLLVALGKQATAEAMTTTIFSKTTISNTAARQFSTIFTVPATGAAYVGFHLMTTTDPQSNTFYLHNVVLQETYNQNVPAAVSGLSVAPGAQGALQTAISFTTPTRTIDGRGLSELSQAIVYRDSRQVKTFDAPGLGQQLSFTDTEVTTGSHTYTIVAANGYGEGVVSQATVYVGKDTPGAIENLRFEYDQNTHRARLTWDAPTVGAHGGYLDTEGITYDVRRYHQSSPQTTGITACSYEDEVGTDFLKQAEEAMRKQYEDMGYNVLVQYVIDGQGLMQYYVRPVSAQGEQGGWTSSNPQIIGGQNTLPYTESFAGGMLSHYWRTDIGSAQARWTVMEDSRYTQDGDGGMLVVNSILGSSETAMAHTGNISMKDAVTPVLNFYYYYPYALAQPLTVKVAKEGGDFETLATIPLDDESQKGRYIRATVPLTGCSGHDYVQVGFEVTMGTSVDLVYLDNVTIIDQRQHDLSVEIASLPRNLKAGEARYMTATVSNLGTDDVATGQYSVEVYANGVKAGSSMGTAVAAGQSQAIMVQLQATIDMQAESQLYAEVVYAADEAPANNRSEEQTISVKLPRYPEPTGLSATTQGETVALNWGTPAAPRTEDGVVTDSFEQYTDFQRTNFGDWTLYDLDHRLTYAIDGWKFPGNSDIMSYLVWNASQVENRETGAKGLETQGWYPRTGDKCLASFVAALDNSDDWLVSPELSGNQQVVSFYAHAIGSGSFPEQFQFYISTTGIETTNFMALDQSPRTVINNQWQQFEYALPQGTKYFALRKVTSTDDGWALLVDDVTFAPDTLAAQTGLMLFGYNIYKNGTRVNTTLVSQPTYTDAEGKAGDVYRVTAVYNQGESVYSNAATAQGTDGIVAVSPAAAPAAGPLYNLNGQRLTAHPRRGIAIQNGQKIIIK